MDCFQELGDRLDERWRASGYDERALPPIAVDLMRSEGVLERIDVHEVLRTAAEGGGLDAFQQEHEFGDLSYTVFRNRRFYIEVLVWTTGDTSIHDHAFSGAFGVIRGSSLCVVYDFELRARINSRFKVGDLAVSRCEHLKANDVRPIPEAPGLIHAVYHLDSPTATLVVRTPGNPDALPQFSYSPAGLAVAQSHVDVVARKQWKALGVMLQTDYARGEACALGALKRATVDARYRIVTGLDYGALPPRFATRVRDLLAETPFGTRIWDSLRVDRERDYLARLRGRLGSPHLRLLHAAVMNIPDRCHRADFLRRALTEAGCRGAVARCMEELTSEGIVKWGGGHEDLADVVCGHLFDGHEGARARLAKGNDLFLRCLAA